MPASLAQVTVRNVCAFPQNCRNYLRAYAIKSLSANQKRQSTVIESIRPQTVLQAEWRLEKEATVCCDGEQGFEELSFDNCYCPED